MKTFLHTIIACLATTICLAQTNVNIKINHLLNSNEFSETQTGINNLDEEFDVTRLEYYLSGFSINYDDGQTTEPEILHVLADAYEETVFNFGMVNGSIINSLTFYIGVDEANNHLDPASWAPGHPLAPQNPSMHWGWAAGYRFLAIEGTDIATTQDFELHGLEDENYFSVTLPVAEIISENEVTLVINANYEQILNNIELAQAPLVHGGYSFALEALENMAADVFEYNGVSVGISENYPSVSVSLYPNPTNDGNGSITIDGTTSEQMGLEIFDILGKKVFELNGISAGKRTDFHISKAGMYIVRVSTNGSTILTQKLVVQ